MFLGISDSIEACVIRSPNYLSAPHSEFRLLLSLPPSRAQTDHCENLKKNHVIPLVKQNYLNSLSLFTGT